MIHNSDHVISNFVPRGTFLKLQLYVELLKKWQNKLNLISNSTLDDIWTRHIYDSFQLLQYIDQKNLKLVDVGSGAGFPGLVLNICGCLNVYLIEKDQKKVFFLKEVARQLELNVNIVHNFVEKCHVENIKYFTARAFAPLSKLLNHVTNHKTKDIECIFLKGKTSHQEIKEAEQSWKFDIQIYPSLTSFESNILHLKNIKLKETF